MLVSVRYPSSAPQPEREEDNAGQATRPEPSPRHGHLVFLLCAIGGSWREWRGVGCADRSRPPCEIELGGTRCREESRGGDLVSLDGALPGGRARLLGGRARCVAVGRRSPMRRHQSCRLSAGRGGAGVRPAARARWSIADGGGSPCTRDFRRSASNAAGSARCRGRQAWGSSKGRGDAAGRRGTAGLPRPGGAWPLRRGVSEAGQRQGPRGPGHEKARREGAPLFVEQWRGSPVRSVKERLAVVGIVLQVRDVRA
jgi:hypothetical protein